MSLSNLKKGDTVILHMFTGIAVGVKEILSADKSTVTLETRVGKAKFSRKTGKQIEPPAKADRFANFITEDDGSYEPADRPKRKPIKKAKASPKKEEVEPDEDDEDEEETRSVKKSKAKDKKSAAKKLKKAAESDEDEDLDDEYEDIEEDEE